MFKRFPRIRFSLFGLLFAIAVFGVVLACIVNFGLSLPMVTIIWSVLLLSLMITPALAFVGVQRRRMFYAGFAWFGWMYILICVLGIVTHSANSFAPSSPLAYPQLAIENGMFAVYKRAVPRESWMLNSSPKSFRELGLGYDSQMRNPPQPAPAVTVPVGGMGGPPPGVNSPGGNFFSGTMPMIPTPQQPHRIIPWVVCRDIGHALLAVLGAILGGCLVFWIARRNSGREKANAPTAL